MNKKSKKIAAKASSPARRNSASVGSSSKKTSKKSHYPSWDGPTSRRRHYCRPTVAPN
jgi:hypothetical protein